MKRLLQPLLRHLVPLLGHQRLDRDRHFTRLLYDFAVDCTQRVMSRDEHLRAQVREAAELARRFGEDTPPPSLPSVLYCAQRDLFWLAVHLLRWAGQYGVRYHFRLTDREQRGLPDYRMWSPQKVAAYKRTNNGTLAAAPHAAARQLLDHANTFVRTSLTTWDGQPMRSTVGEVATLRRTLMETFPDDLAHVRLPTLRRAFERRRREEGIHK